MKIAAQCVSHGKLPISFQSRPSFFASNSVPKIILKNTFPTQLHGVHIKQRQHKKLWVVLANSEAQIPPSVVSTTERWLLEPVGDGNFKHIGFKVAMPGAYEVASDEIIVGRLPEKADMVISVATVSGQHARIRKKGGNLFVTDLDSTNGTFIDEKRLSPGVASVVLPGSCVTFGDIHLAIFRVSKLKPDLEASSNPQEETEASTN